MAAIEAWWGLEAVGNETTARKSMQHYAAMLRISTKGSARYTQPCNRFSESILRVQLTLSRYNGIAWEDKACRLGSCDMGDTV